MWKISRNIIIPRWCPNHNHQKCSEKNSNVCPRAVATTSLCERRKYSEQNDWKKEHFNKQSQRFWNRSDFRYILSNTWLLETAGWLGTASVLCFNLHRSRFYKLFDDEKTRSHCPFPRNVFTTPGNASKENQYTKSTLPDRQIKSSPIITEPFTTANLDIEPSILQDIRTKSDEYAAAFHNSAGVSYLKSNSKKAFRSFQAAARLGSSQGFYNLGLCHELGKGTKKNLTRAAFCYRKAAMKGHGLASFNLAIYFHKGLGGLPVDQEASKLLLEQAAAKDIPEALLYIGLEHLETEKWSNAYEVFSKLASKNNVDGKYYLGLCYENGWGVNKDERTAAEIFSQNAASGHSKSILSLVKCYEKGLGGCNPDLDFALALCQILADQGDEEGRKAVLRLKIKKEATKINDFFAPNFSYLGSGKHGVHNSSSVPEITSNKTMKAISYPVSIISSYLDLVSGFASKKANDFYDRKRATFFIGEDKLNINFSNTCIHLQSKIVSTMTRKT